MERSHLLRSFFRKLGELCLDCCSSAAAAQASPGNLDGDSNRIWCDWIRVCSTVRKPYYSGHEHCTPALHGLCFQNEAWYTRGEIHFRWRSALRLFLDHVPCHGTCWVPGTTQRPCISHCCTWPADRYFDGPQPKLQVHQSEA